VNAAQVVTIVITLLVPVVTAVAGVLGVVFQDWRVRRSRVGQRKLALEDASRQVSFATNWWNARKLLADSPGEVKEATTRAMSWLEEASVRVVGAEVQPAEQRRPVTLRRLLLFYPIYGRTANIIRGIFYAFLGLLIWNVGSAISDALGSQRSNYAADLVGLIVIAPVTLGLRFWAAYAQNPHTKTQRAESGIFRRILLFYPLRRFAAIIVRIVYYEAYS
jgi:hypothetical protein